MRLLHKLWLAVFFVGLGTAGTLITIHGESAPAIGILIFSAAILAGLIYHCYVEGWEPENNVPERPLYEGPIDRAFAIERAFAQDLSNTMNFVSVNGRIRTNLNITEDAELHINHVPQMRR